jgi:hypothetical protein
MQRTKALSPELKEKLGIPAAAKIILYSGKYMEKKRPMDLLRHLKFK